MRATPRTACRRAAALYVGDVMHARLKPMGHRFSYRVMSLLIDLDRLAEADRQSPLFGVNRAALYSFHESDHGERDGSSLRAYVQRCAAERGIDLTGGRVLLLCYPRLLGYTFNPLSVYFCYRADGELALLIYEVRNTFGEIHPYVLPVTSGDISEAGVRQQQDKLFYVSPFIEMAMRYHFRVRPPGARVQLRILETDREGPLLAATFNGSRRALNTKAVAARVLRAAAGHPQDHGGDPLGGAAALAQRRAAGAAERRSPQYRLGEHERQRLYSRSVVRPCQELKQGRSTMRGRVDRRSMDRTCPS